MSYTKHTWVDGELVTAAKMNNIENGIEEASSGGSGGGVLVVHDVDGTLDKTWQEIHDAGFCAIAFEAGQNIIYHPLLGVAYRQANQTYSVLTLDQTTDEGIRMYETSSASDYPVLVN